MSSLRWHRRPRLRRPVSVLAFEGWNDAGEAASETVRWLASNTDAEPIAHIEAEEFFDFTATRPEIRTDENGDRVLDWPDTEIWTGRLDDDHDLLLLLGPEPQLRWRTYGGIVADLLEEFDVERTVLLGSLLADLPHTLPSHVSGSSTDPGLRRRLGPAPSRYEGPTGIVGVLTALLRERDLPSASLWAAVPSYIGAPDPKAQLALVEQLLALLDLDLPVTDLQIAVSSYERQLAELVADDPDLAAYVADLEERASEADEAEDDPPDDLASTDPEQLVEEVERFLRGD